MTIQEHSDASEAPVLSTDAVSAGYGARTRRVLRDVSVQVGAGRTLGIVGESGSGKSTLAKVLVGLLAPTTGVVRFGGQDVNLLSRKERFLARRQVQLIPQDPYSSLDPRMTVERALTEAVDPRGRLRPRDHRERITGLLESVSLDGAAARRFPHEFSGGQRQRIVIARALAVEPRVIVADEVTSSLDVSVQAEILDLLMGLQRRLGLSYVFITHDLAIARKVCTDLSVLYLGGVVEQGASDILVDPDHPYSQLLRDSVPDPNGLSMPATAVPISDDDVADPANPPSGCVFHPRCPYGPTVLPDRGRCETVTPMLQDSDSFDGRRTACHYPLGRIGQLPATGAGLG